MLGELYFVDLVTAGLAADAVELRPRADIHLDLRPPRAQGHRKGGGDAGARRGRRSVPRHRRGGRARGRADAARQSPRKMRAVGIERRRCDLLVAGRIAEAEGLAVVALYGALCAGVLGPGRWSAIARLRRPSRPSRAGTATSSAEDALEMVRATAATGSSWARRPSAAGCSRTSRRRSPVRTAQPGRARRRRPAGGTRRTLLTSTTATRAGRSRHPQADRLYLRGFRPGRRCETAALVDGCSARRPDRTMDLDALVARRGGRGAAWLGGSPRGGGPARELGPALARQPTRPSAPMSGPGVSVSGG